MLIITAVAVVAVADPIVPDGYSIGIIAEHPMVLDTAAFCFDDDGAMYVAETQRQDRGVEDNRNSPFWLIDDLASRTIEDRYRVVGRRHHSPARYRCRWHL